MATSTTPGSDAFISSLTSMVNREDTTAILQAQMRMLSRFEKTNEMLSNFNKLSASRYEKTVEQFKEHTQVLMEMKRDLDIVFRKIRVLKDRLSSDYPASFEAASQNLTETSDEESDMKTGKDRDDLTREEEDKPTECSTQETETERTVNSS
ncbi:kxDL motif-containing protein 1-like [Patiria miniata]|uniref:KxDL domain-containing protein n=1 Tax=Patiria miniata TaxID=46514 RepID=A0A914BCZ7_PATMI|nr:kxDL motif-containing protein 1-like [Patiria miniata]XP_038073720.1 kxDL motif-containing protein 1-like [Patiria miniata]XP_038073721.1 kxDL motif-containing protein 1-like [Patiria miniata]